MNNNFAVLAMPIEKGKIIFENSLTFATFCPSAFKSFILRQQFVRLPFLLHPILGIFVPIPIKNKILNDFGRYERNNKTIFPA